MCALVTGVQTCALPIYPLVRQRAGKFAVAADFAGIHLFPTIQVFLGCLPIYAVMTRGHAPLGWLDTVAAIVTFGAITIELVADFQLHHFIATKKPGSFQIGRASCRERVGPYV